MKRFRNRRRAVLAGAIALVVLGACRQDMHDNPRYESLEGSAFFPDGRSARPLAAEVVARGQLRDDDHLYRGKQGREFVETFPFPIDEATLHRGRERYDVYCSPCHSRTGEGDGMVVQRGFKVPPSLHEPRLRDAAAGYFFDVITNGFGVMPDYAVEVAVRDRWAIVAYIRALQRSRNATLADVPREHRSQLDADAEPGVRPSNPDRGPQSSAKPAPRGTTRNSVRYSEESRGAQAPAIGRGPTGADYSDGLLRSTEGG